MMHINKTKIFLLTLVIGAEAANHPSTISRRNMERVSVSETEALPSFLPVKLYLIWLILDK